MREGRAQLTSSGRARSPPQHGAGGDGAELGEEAESASGKGSSEEESSGSEDESDGGGARARELGESLSTPLDDGLVVAAHRACTPATPPGAAETIKELAAATVAATSAPTAEEMRIMYGPASGRRVGVRGQRGTAAGREQVAKAKNRAKAELDELLGLDDDGDEDEGGDGGQREKEAAARAAMESVKKKPERGGKKGRRRRREVTPLWDDGVE